MSKGQGTKDSQRKIFEPARVAIVVILLAAWFLRIHDLGDSSFWLDEVLSFERALLPDWAAGREALIRANHAPLYEWVVLRTWLKAGDSEFWARFPGAVLSLLTIGVTYALAMSLFRKRALALWASLFLATSALYLGFVRWVRPYALLSLLLSLAVFALWRALMTGRRHYWLAYGLLAAGALYTHYFAVFTLIALGILVLIRVVVEKDGRLLFNWVLVTALAALLFLPWFPVFDAQMSDGAVEWIEPLTLTMIGQLPAELVTWALFASPVTFVVSAVLWILLAIGLVAWLRLRSQLPYRWSYPYIALAAGGTVLLVNLIALTKSLFVARYFLGILPAISIVIAFSVVYGRPRYLAIGLTVLALVPSLVASYLIVSRQTAEDWGAVAAYIETNSNDDDTLVQIAESPSWTEAFNHYYQGPLTPGFVPGELSDPTAVQTAIDENCPCQRIWLFQSARRTSRRTLSYGPEDDYAGYHVVKRVKFDQNLIGERLAVDLWLLEKAAD